MDCKKHCSILSKSISTTTHLESDGVLLLEVVEQLLLAIENEDQGSISDAHLSALHSIFPQNLLHALDLVERDCITCYICSSPLRKLYQVQGTSNKHYICFESSLYCSCPSFVYSVCVKGDSLMCKHQLAICLASAINTCKQVQVTGKEWAALASTDNPSAPH